jgi:cytochrome c553
MNKKLAVVGLLSLAAVAAGGLYIQSADATAKKQIQAPARKKVKEVKVAQCFECHDKEIKQFHTTGKHAKVNCAYCHPQPGSGTGITDQIG